MTAVWLTLLIPLAGIVLMALIGHTRVAGWVNVALAAVTFTVSVWLALIVYADGPLLSPSRMLYIDAFNVYLVTLTAFVGLTTAIFSRPYMLHEVETRRIGKGRMRLYHSMYQGFMFAMLAALTTNNVGILWVAMEGATLATVLLVSLYRTPEAVEAAWKYFVLCGVGIAQALFGTVLLFFAAERVAPTRDDALLWNVLYDVSTQLEPTVLTLSFVFLLVGYGTKVGLVPLHNWLPDAHSEGPTPMSAILSGLLLNVALYALVRVKMIVDGSLHSNLAGHLMMGFGLLSFMVAGLFLHRQRDIKRMFSYSSIEHMGLMTFAFGIGGPIATFGALLHMTVHSLTKSAIFVTVGHAAQIAGTQTIEKIRGLIRTQPTVGWGLLLGTVAIAGFPPFGVFTSEFLVLIATMKSWPWLTVPLLVGLAIAFAGLFRHIHPMVYGDPPEGQAPVRANMLPVMIQLGLVLWLGIAIPVFLSKWFEQATVLISGSSPL
ncbi:MAG: hydrogenase 4 subunit F [Candidatus Muproteobacteria bacterium RIFCSPHIGHO2_12_FULL_60_33]|nr:MAG: hydrogenase 4 subunit F [Candidatus Muproteobacteria bacterium RIFCSPHIGHO2_02_FULL_60_13]OGI56063.1 MAG: hydrogenase 4 subunit F [Candidatus Muproteobacteria bacterium RIFCSPHIGHO2_12_FULL_60_33]OGI59117.1 MAG: hydrogenase 4 subunit F [Candidatus Muproteobacteria bacterium RIFCSPHIGHO2_01_FULL_61_200]